MSRWGGGNKNITVRFRVGATRVLEYFGVFGILQNTVEPGREENRPCLKAWSNAVQVIGRARALTGPRTALRAR